LLNKKPSVITKSYTSTNVKDGGIKKSILSSNNSQSKTPLNYERVVTEPNRINSMTLTNSKANSCKHS